MSKISICTYCKGRLHHAIQSIPHTLSLLDKNDELILVDYDCPNKVGEWCEQNYPNVKVVFVKNRHYWHASHAHNCAAMNAKNDIILFLDIDILLNEKQIEEIRNMTEGNFLRGNKHLLLHSYGLCAVYKKDYMEVNGYEEAIVGWGYEDKSFFDSLKKLGLMENLFINSSQDIPHSRDETKLFLAIGNANCNMGNKKISNILKSRHPFKNNINRNWGLL